VSDPSAQFRPPDDINNPPPLPGAVEHAQANPIPRGSESLEVWSACSDPWTFSGTIIRKGGRNGTIVCDPPSLECLVRRPRMMAYDPMDYLTRWSNGACCVWPPGEAPGAPPAEPATKDLTHQ
jgi:hypothetical protein